MRKKRIEKGREIKRERDIERVRDRQYRKINHKPRSSSTPTNKTKDEKTLEQME